MTSHNTRHLDLPVVRSTVGASIGLIKHRQFKIMTCADLAGLILWSLVTWLNTLPARSLTHATRGCLRGLLTSVPHSYAFTSIQERLPTLGSILEAEDERSYAAASAQPHPEPIPQIWYPVLFCVSLACSLFHSALNERAFTYSLYGTALLNLPWQTILLF